MSYALPFAAIHTLPFLSCTTLNKLLNSCHAVQQGGSGIQTVDASKISHASKPTARLAIAVHHAKLYCINQCCTSLSKTAMHHAVLLQYAADNAWISHGTSLLAGPVVISSNTCQVNVGNCTCTYPLDHSSLHSQEARVKPDAAVWNALIAAAGRAGQLQRALEALQDMQVCLWWSGHHK